jgi:hypothetical protein
MKTGFQVNTITHFLHVSQFSTNIVERNNAFTKKYAVMVRLMVVMMHAMEIIRFCFILKQIIRTRKNYPNIESLLISYRRNIIYYQRSIIT